MATDIKRVRFFDGQFLKEGDFQAEQLYHSHLRRRMNFLMFQQSGVLPLTPADLTLEVVSAPAKTFKIKAGTAIAQNLKEQEGRELILVDDSDPIDLVAAGITAGQVAVVSLHWEQVPTDLSTDGEVSEETRFFEQAVINVGLSKPATPIATGDPYVQLGTISFDGLGSVTIADTGREVALLRSALIATVPAPIITGVIGVTSAAVGPVTMTIQGSNLGGATVVTFNDAQVTATLGANTATTLDVTVNIGPGATPGPKSFIVQTASGLGFSPPGVVFTVLQPAPTITGMPGPATAVAGGPAVAMTINGTNLTGATVSFPGAVGITVLPGVITSATSVTFQVQATGAATAGLKVVRVDTGGGNAISVAPVGLTVIVPPTIASVSGVTSVVANNVAVPGIVINGTNLTGGALSFPLEPLLSVDASLVNAAGTQMTVTLRAPLAVTAGNKQFRITTAPGVFADSGAGVFIGVTAPVPPPTVSAISLHTSTKPKVTAGVIITGTNLTGATSVAFFLAPPSGLLTTEVTASALSVNAAGTQLTLTITVTAAADSDSYTFKVTTTPGNTADSTGIPGTNFAVL